MWPFLVFLISLTKLFLTRRFIRSHRTDRPLGSHVDTKGPCHIKFTFFTQDGTAQPMNEVIPKVEAHNTTVAALGEDVVDGLVFMKPAAVMLDDGKFTLHRLPDDGPTWVKIDLKKSRRVPRAVKNYFLGTNEHLYVYLPEESGQFTVGAWVDGMKVQKNPNH